jgi:Protein of unknown function (DUF3710)
VSLFKRRASADSEGETDDVVDQSDNAEDNDADDNADEPDAPVLGERRAAAQAAAQLRANGPFDLSEVGDTADLLDLGSLLVAPVEDMQLQLELNEEDGEHVVGVTVLIADSAVQVQAFAAPRSEGIWDEVREEIASGITQQGGTADEADGSFGRELLARVPNPTPEGRTEFRPARFIGVDGPRWFLRAVFTGPAIDPEHAESLERLVRSLVVVRGQDAMAPRELLPLKLPTMPGDEAAAETAGDEATAHVDDLNPFERGPEITEIR